MFQTQRNEHGLVIFVRTEDAKSVAFTTSILSLLGYSISSGFIGSNIFLNVYYTPLATQTLQQEYKVAVIGVFQIRQENTETLSLTFGSVRHFLDDCGMRYSRHLVLPPCFVSESRIDFNAFLKGLILGSYSPQIAVTYSDISPVVFSVPNIDFANSLSKMLSNFEIEHDFYINQMHMLIKPNQRNQRYLAWLLDPDSGSIFYKSNPAWEAT